MENLENKDIKELVAEVREMMAYDWDGMEQKVIQEKRNAEKAKRDKEKAVKQAERKVEKAVKQAERKVEKAIKQAKREKQRADAAEAKRKLLLAERARLKSEIEKSSPL